MSRRDKRRKKQRQQRRHRDNYDASQGRYHIPIEHATFNGDDIGDGTITVTMKPTQPPTE